MEFDTTFGALVRGAQDKPVAQATVAAGLAVLSVECLLNLPSELALYASRGRYLAKAMLFTVRYLALSCCILLLRVVWNLSNSSKQECKYSTRFSALLGVTSMMVASFSFLIRTYAICRHSRVVLCVLIPLLLSEAVMAALVVAGFRPIFLADGSTYRTAGPLCMATIPRPWVIGAWSGIKLVFDALVLTFVLSSLRGFRKSSGGTTSFIESLRSRQVGYFALTTAIYLTATVLFATDMVRAGYFISFIPALTSIAAQRVILADISATRAPPEFVARVASIKQNLIPPADRCRSDRRPPVDDEELQEARPSDGDEEEKRSQMRDRVTELPPRQDSPTSLRRTWTSLRRKSRGGPAAATRPTTPVVVRPVSLLAAQLSDQYHARRREEMEGRLSGAQEEDALITRYHLADHLERRMLRVANPTPSPPASALEDPVKWIASSSSHPVPLARSLSEPPGVSLHRDVPSSFAAQDRLVAANKFCPDEQGGRAEPVSPAPFCCSSSSLVHRPHDQQHGDSAAAVVATTTDQDFAPVLHYIQEISVSSD